MTLLTLGLILLAALFHASWNLLSKRVGGGGAPFVWLFGSLAAVIYAPLAIGVIVAQRPHLGAAQLAFIVGSTCLHLIYFIVLQRGYRAGDMSLVYPLARGLGPTLSTIGAVALFGERPSLVALAGAVLVVGSVFSITGGTAALRKSAAHEAIRFGFITGCMIATYTLWDKHAVSVILVPPLLLDWGSSVCRTVLMAPIAARRWKEVQHLWRAYRWETVGVAVLSPLAYILVLTALSLAPVSHIAPAREISILIGTIMGARFLDEGDATRRILAACGMVAGVVALTIG